MDPAAPQVVDAEEEYEEEDFDEDEELYDEEEDDEEEGAAPTGFGAFLNRAAGGAKKKTVPTDSPDWVGLKNFPAATQKGLFDSLSALRQQGKNSITVLLVGKNAVGKSATCNSILGEKVFQASAFQAPTAGEPQMVGRSASGFTLNVIDTPGLLDGDTVNEDSLNLICGFLEDKEVDAVLYVDRLDTYRMQTVDEQIVETLTARFGPYLWNLTMIVLTHGNVPTPAGMTYGPFVEERANQFRNAIKKMAPEAASAKLPVAVVENGSRCKTNGDGEKILTDGTVWLVQLMSKLAGLVTGDEKLDTGAGLEPADVYATKNRWLVWPLLALQLLVAKPLLCRQIRNDPDYN